MNLEQPPINKTPPRKASLADALLEQYKQETGPGGDPDAYLKREAPPTPTQRAHRNATVKANQLENLN